jgi:hypothetical protein
MFIMCLVVFTGCGGGGGSSDDGGGGTTYYRDVDGDGYGDPGDTTEADSPPTGYVEEDTDCDDSNPDINPGVTELCTDGVDNNCDGDSDTTDATCAVTLMEEGVFTMINFHGDEGGGVWDVDSMAVDVSLDGVDTADIDLDRDGDFSDDTGTYEVLEDGSFIIDGGPIGVYSDDESIVAMTQADVPDEMDFLLGVREGTGMSVDTFSGPYVVMKYAANKATGVAHTYLALAEETGSGLGIFRIGQSSDPAAVGAAAPFTYTIDPNGNIEFVDSHEEGKIVSDGSFFMAADTNTSNDLETVMVGLPIDEAASGTVINADLSGEYIANLIGYNMATGDYWTARVLATFDGVGLLRYEFLAFTTGGGGATGYLAYVLDSSGTLIVGPPYQYGVVSADRQMFCLVDTSTADGQTYLMVGIKRQT